MKLTEEKLKQMIAEELKNLAEQEPAEQQPDANQNAQNQAQKPESGNQDKKVASMGRLGDEFIQVGRAIKSSKIKNIDSGEIPLVSGLLADILQIASDKPAKTLLQRLRDRLESFK